MKKISNNKYKVTFLVDNKNTWFSKYLNIFPIKNKKYIFKVSSNVKKVFNQDVLFIINYTKILNKKRLLQNKLNLVIHSSNLPKNRGGAPLHWQILRNKKKIKICLFEAIEKLDAGNIIFQKEIDIEDYDLQVTLYYRVMFISLMYLENVLKKVKNKYTGKKQIGKGTYYSRGAPFDGKINKNWSIKKINAFIKAMIFPPRPLAKIGNKFIKNKSEIK